MEANPFFPVRHVGTLDSCLFVTDHVRSIWKGNVFGRVCPSVHRKGSGGCPLPQLRSGTWPTVVRNGGGSWSVYLTMLTRGLSCSRLWNVHLAITNHLVNKRFLTLGYIKIQSVHVMRCHESENQERPLNHPKQKTIMTLCHWTFALLTRKMIWWQHSGEFFVFNTNLTFLYKIDIEGFKKKKKLSPSGIWTHNSNHHWIRILIALPTQLICQSMAVSDFQTLIKSCSTDSRNDPTPV